MFIRPKDVGNDIHHKMKMKNMELYNSSEDGYTNNRHRIERIGIGLLYILVQVYEGIGLIKRNDKHSVLCSQDYRFESQRVLRVTKNEPFLSICPPSLD